MPRKRITHNRADIRAQWQLMEEMGLEPVSVKFHPDGTFRIMTAKHAAINKPVQTGELASNPWDEVFTHGPS